MTAAYTVDFLRTMHEAHPSVIAKDGDRVVGYALVATQAVRLKNRLLTAGTPCQYTKAGACQNNADKGRYKSSAVHTAL